MKKKWLQTLALGFAACFAFGATGCGEEKTAGVDEEKIFSTVKSAYQATVGYDGAITVETTCVEGAYELADDETQEETETWRVSIDYDEGIYYMEREDSDLLGNAFYACERVEPYDDAYYVREYATETEMENGTASTDEETDVRMMSNIVHTIRFSEDWTGMADVDLEEGLGMFYMNNGEQTSFSQIKNAYNGVGNDIAKKVKEVDPNGSCTWTASASMNGGAYMITTALQMQMQDEGMGGTLKSSQIMKVVAKDGKLTQLNGEYEAQLLVDGVVTASETEKVNVNISYAFDQAGYDALEDKLDMTTTPTRNTIDYISLKFNVDGKVLAEEEISIYKETDMTTAEAFGYLTNNSTLNAMNIDGWYIDAECTKPFDPTATSLEELALLGTVYTKNATVKEGTALIFFCRDKEHGLGTAYGWVFGDVGYTSDWYGIVRTISSNEEENVYDLTINSYYYESSDFVLVNGSMSLGTTVNYTNTPITFIVYYDQYENEEVLEDFFG